jgi:hypothetical protein
MALFLAAFLFVHGLIHLLGTAKAWHLAQLPQLSQPISPLSGGLWLAASLLFCAAAICLVAHSRWWWFIGSFAIVISTIAIVPSWADARLGAVANLVALIAVVRFDDRVAANRRHERASEVQQRGSCDTC